MRQEIIIIIIIIIMQRLTRRVSVIRTTNRERGDWDGSRISWTVCKQSAPRSRLNNNTNTSSRNFYRLDDLHDAKPTASKH